MPNEKISLALPTVAKSFGFSELFGLSTCNRFEIFALRSQKDTAPDKTTMLRAFLALNPQLDGSFQESHLNDATYFLQDADAIKHAFNVASSLDSLIVGETQITAQFKEAIILAKEAGTLGSILDRLSQEALATSKKIRSQTDVSKKPVSISHAAIDLAHRIYGDLSQAHILIIGAGEMAELAARYALNYKPKSLLICNRNIERAQTLVQKLGTGVAYGFNDLNYCMHQANVMISATAATQSIVNKLMVESVIKGRRNQPLYIIDIGLPRNVEQAAGQLDDVYLFDIDDLKQIVSENKDSRSKAADLASEMIVSAVENFHRWLSQKNIAPTLAAYHFYVKNLVFEEYQKTLSREQFKALNPEQIENLKKLQEAIGNKLTAQVTSTLKNTPIDSLPTALSFIEQLTSTNRKP